MARVSSVRRLFALEPGDTLFTTSDFGWVVAHSCIIYAPGTILYVMARRENDRKIFTVGELTLGVVLWLGAIAGVAGLVTGSITI